MVAVACRLPQGRFRRRVWPLPEDLHWTTLECGRCACRYYRNALNGISRVSLAFVKQLAHRLTAIKSGLSIAMVEWFRGIFAALRVLTASSSPKPKKSEGHHSKRPDRRKSAKNVRTSSLFLNRSLIPHIAANTLIASLLSLAAASIRPSCCPSCEILLRFS